eukprot:7930946-Pyramimonas_sp.AAC.1
MAGISPTSFAFGAEFEDVSCEAPPKGGPPGVSHSLRSRPDRGDVSGGVPVLVANVLRFRSRFGG